MSKIALIPEEEFNEIKENQLKILTLLQIQNSQQNDENYISKQTAAQRFDCSDQTIKNFVKEGLIQEYGRGRFKRYDPNEIKRALGIN